MFWTSIRSGRQVTPAGALLSRLTLAFAVLAGCAALGSCGGRTGGAAEDDDVASDDDVAPDDDGADDDTFWVPDAVSVKLTLDVGGELIGFEQAGTIEWAAHYIPGEGMNCAENWHVSVWACDNSDCTWGGTLVFGEPIAVGAEGDLDLPVLGAPYPVDYPVPWFWFVTPDLGQVRVLANGTSRVEAYEPGRFVVRFEGSSVCAADRFNDATPEECVAAESLVTFESTEGDIVASMDDWTSEPSVSEKGDPADPGWCLGS
ncbi:hypothetical protein L6R50_01675 [Myxococcota bacterium]|nr:hypothetical protein [Myxococcota bacterium]